MRLSAIPLRTKLLLGALAGVLSLWLVTAVQARTLERQMKPFAAQHLAENRLENAESTATVTVGQKFLLFGDTEAKVEVFVRPKPFGTQDRITGIEYHYELGDGGWRLTDSSACTAESCQIRGARAFKSNSSAGPL